VVLDTFNLAYADHIMGYQPSGELCDNLFVYRVNRSVSE